MLHAPKSCWNFQGCLRFGRLKILEFPISMTFVLQAPQNADISRIFVLAALKQCNFQAVRSPKTLEFANVCLLALKKIQGIWFWRA